MSGIASLTDRADLASRSITIHLDTIPDEQRRAEDEFEAEFAAAVPRLLGALLDAVSMALRNVDKVKLDRSPRMADFVKWTKAAEPALGLEEGVFERAYTENRRDVTDEAFEADPVAVAIADFVRAEHPTGWTGTATELLAALGNRVPEPIRKSRYWPSTIHGLGQRV